MGTLLPLLENTLVVVAHPDDEVIGCGGLMQRMEEVRVVFATDGAALAPRFWAKFSSRDDYASARKLEACDALAYADVDQVEFLATPEGSKIPDQELYQHLDAAAESLRAIIQRTSPKALLTLAYEGGHPDHDCCSFLVNHLASVSGIPAWEMPLYHFASSSFTRQQFRDPDETEIALDATYPEMKQKQLMLAAYTSQSEMLNSFSPAKETFRTLSANRYNYFHPPYPGQLNYEAWGFSMTGDDVCAAFADFLHARLSAERRSA